ncbi:MAG TPA: hypothetical protein VK631_29835 [Solirubrobacteraceae bacterium]|nr:hypothetical protein [Solirubrobacteraceae bacterium]
MGTRLLASGLAALALAGCGGGGAAEKKPPEAKLSAEAQKAIDELDASARPPDDAADIQRLLSERARALEAEDVLALSATAIGRQRARDRRSALRAKRLAIERIRFVPEDLQTTGHHARIAVTMSYRVRGMRRPFLTSRRILARKKSVGWRVTSDKPRSEPLPWEVHPFHALRSRHVVLLAPRGMDAAPLRSGLERAYREIRRDLPRRDLPPSVLVIAAKDARQAEQLTGRIASGVVAIANVSVEWGPPPALAVERVLAQRLIVVVDRWRTQDAAARQSTLVHEMTHTALDPDTSARTPPWLAEGVAMYVSNDDRSVEARARASGLAPSVRLRRLCKPNSIFRLRGSKQDGAYAVSSAAAETIVARRGNKGLFKLYDAFNDSRIPGRPGARTTDRVLRRTLGMSLAQLDAAATGG